MAATGAMPRFRWSTPPVDATANVTSGTIDVKGILDWLIANNTTQYGKFDNTWTLDQVQWGFEIQRGRRIDAGVHKQLLLGLVELAWMVFSCT